MKVPFLDVSQTYFRISSEIDSAIDEVLKSGHYILGGEVDQFEHEWAKFCSSSYAVSVGNGLDALKLSLLAVGVEPNDEVLVPAHTYIASWLAISLVGAVPVPVDSNPYTYNIDVSKLENALTRKTRVVMPVHLYGVPADMSEITKFARAHNLKIVEDAAQAHGASYRGRKIGSIGDAVAWSFYPSKNLGCFGDGGAVTTNSEEIFERVKLLRNYGSQKRFHNEIIGYNSRLDPIQAAVLRTKLKHLENWNQKRTQIANKYLSSLGDTGIVLPAQSTDSTSSWHLFVIRHQERDRMQQFLAEREIETSIHYPTAIFDQPAYNNLDLDRSKYQIAREIAATSLSLPIGPHLENEAVEKVCSVLFDFK